MESYINIHKSCKRALPSQLIEIKHAIMLHKLYNEQLPVADWIDLNFDQILTSRQMHFKITKSNTFKIGNNKLATSLSNVTSKIQRNDLILSVKSLKVKYKKIYSPPTSKLTVQI